jgi:hypothetical protein
MPKDVSTRSRLKTAIESSLAHLASKMLNKDLDFKMFESGRINMKTVR